MDGPGRRVGSRFGPYELRSLLGKGGMGEVYEAYDTVKDRVVAVKLLSEELAQDPGYQVRFRRESQAAARLAEPHIIPIHDWGVIDGTLFIDMRLVPGLDLRSLLRHEGTLSAERAIGIIEQIAAGLDAAHADGLVHRDVKPANILVTEADFAYLVDFGIAHTEGDSAMTQVGMAIGSYTYMAPERFDVGDVTGRADIYSLACVLHECLTGSTPFPAASMSVLIRSHLSQPPPRPSVQRPGIPAAMDAVIARGMAKDPDDRYPTAMDLARSAKATLGTPPTPATPTFVVRAPDPATFGQSDPSAMQRHSAFIPPETTGELVIHPTGPTVVTQTDLQFTPLPPQRPAATPFGPPAPYESTPVRSFPDAHLYREGRQHSGGQQYPDAQDPGGEQFSEPQRYSEPRGFSEPEGFSEPQQYSEPRGYSEPRLYRGPQQYADQAPETQRYEAPPRPEPPFYPEPQPFSDPQQFSGAPSNSPFQPSPQPQHAAGRDFRASEYSAATDYQAREDYSSPSGYDDDNEDYYGPDSATDPYYPPPRRQSVVMPIVIGVLVVALLSVAGVVGWKLLGSSSSETSATGVESGALVTASARPNATPTTTTAPVTTSASASSTPVALPESARPCSAGGPGQGTFTHAAAGSQVTSCEFAEAVREAYAESAATNVSRAPRSVVATSPVTGRVYTMNCAADGQLVTCSGGENAVVYVY
ncbi:protein kinase domain-containing protein [Nocardia sp. KC 131]|uniref:serine/threonine-protein kinase n=1 Tax=Nocardia arseniciresistens TaxID=3392119 RepID=UPI00398E76CC